MNHVEPINFLSCMVHLFKCLFFCVEKLFGILGREFYGFSGIFEGFHQMSLFLQGVAVCWMKSTQLRTGCCFATGVYWGLFSSMTL